MRRTRTRRHRRIRLSPVDYGMTLFVTLVGLWVISRINFLSAVVLVPDCLSIQPALLGQEGRVDGVLDTVALAGLAALGLIAVTAVAGWHEKTLNWTGAAIGAANAGLAGLLIAQWIIGWSFFHPDSWQAKVVMPLGPEVRRLHLQTASERRGPFEGMPGWQPVGPNAYYNAEIGIVAREERIKTCYSAAFVRQNMLNMNPDGLSSGGVPIASIPDAALERDEYAFIYYDRDNQYLTSESYWEHDEYAELRKRDADRDASGRRVDPAEIWHLVEASLDAAYEKPVERPYTLEEINDMVRETWDRQAPIP